MATAGTPPYTYLWSNGETTFDADSLWAGSHSCDIIDAAGCPYTTVNTLIIANPPAIDISVTNTPPTCNSSVTQTTAGAYTADGSLQVTPTGGTSIGGTYNCEWFDATTMVSLLIENGVASSTLPGLEAGNYFCKITDDNSCDTLHPMTLLEPTVVTFNPTVVTDVDCFGNITGEIDITVTDGTGSYTYSWVASNGGSLAGDNGSTSEDLSSLTAGTYTVTVTDANVCIKSAIITIDQPAATLDITGATSLSVEPTCNILNPGPSGSEFGTVTLTPSGGTGPYTYLWKDAGGLDLFPTQTSATGNSILAGINYQCLITDDKGCTFLWDDQISGPSQITLVPHAPDSVSCFGLSDATANQDLPTGGSETGWTYNWDDPSSQTTQNAFGLAAAVPSTTYTVQVFDGNLCEATTTVDVLSPSELTANIDVTNVLCNGASTGELEIVPIGSLTASWPTAPGGGSPWDSTFLAGTACLEWESLTDPAFIHHMDDPHYQNLPAGNYQLTLRDVYGCENTILATVDQNPAINIVPVITPISLSGADDGAISVGASGGSGTITNYDWIGVNTLGAPLTITTPAASNISLLAPGIYTITVTDNEFCTEEMNIPINDPGCNTDIDGFTDLILLDTIQPLCFGLDGSVAWTNGLGLAPYTNLLTGPLTTDTIVNNAVFTSSPLVPYSLPEGVYQLTVTDAAGCIDIENFLINPPLLFEATIVTTRVECNGETNGSSIISLIGGTGPGTYTIDYGIADPSLTHLNLPAGNYIAQVADANGCEVTYPSVGLPGSAVYPTGLISYTIFQPSALVVSVPAVMPIPCLAITGGTASVSVVGGFLNPFPPVGYTYSWDNGEITSDLANLSTSLIAGDYTCTITDDNGCLTTDSFTISSSSLITVSADFDQSQCQGIIPDSLFALGSTSGNNYSW